MEKFIANMKKAEVNVTKLEKDFLDASAEEIVKKARERTPVDTGVLRASHARTKAKKVSKVVSADVFNSMEYASFLEFGTVKGIEPYFMQTQPLMEFTFQADNTFGTKFKKFAQEMGIE